MDDRLGEVIQRAIQAIGSSLSPLIATFQVEVVSLAFLKVGNWSGCMLVGLAVCCSQCTRQQTSKALAACPNTFDGNAYGVFSHGGSVDVENRDRCGQWHRPQ